MQEYVWIVIPSQGMNITEAEVFDNEADAENFAQEMTVQNKGSYSIIKSAVNSRAKISEEAQHWAELPDFDTECVECLVEEITGVPQENFDPDACAKFLEENKEKLQQKADEIVQEYIRSELENYFLNERVILG